MHLMNLSNIESASNSSNVKKCTKADNLLQEHEWVTAGGTDPLPSEQENCRLVEVTDEDMAQVVTSIPNLSTLILIKTMLKKHSFQVLTNPFYNFFIVSPTLPFRVFHLTTKIPLIHLQQ